MSNRDDLTILWNIVAEEGIESENLLKRFARAKSLGNKVSSLGAINSLNTQNQPVLSPEMNQGYSGMPQEGIVPPTSENSLING